MHVYHFDHKFWMRKLLTIVAFSNATNRPPIFGKKNDNHKSKREQKSYDANHNRLWYYLKLKNKCRCKRNVQRYGRIFSTLVPIAQFEFESHETNENSNRAWSHKVRLVLRKSLLAIRRCEPDWGMECFSIFLWKLYKLWVSVWDAPRDCQIILLL